MTLSTRPRLRLLTLCALYLAQGIPYGFVTVTLVAILAAGGMNAEKIGELTAIAMIPWTLKWVWGPVIDRFSLPAMGRRRPWILLAQLMMALTVLAMAAIDDLASQLKLLSLLVVTHNIFNALQDVAVDALAVDLLSEDERGRANGLMYGSKYLGVGIGGAGLATLEVSVGLQTTLFFQVGMLGAIMLLPLLLRERPGERLLPWSRGQAAPSTQTAGADSLFELFRALFMAFRVRAGLLTALLAVLMSIGGAVAGTINPILLTQQLGWEADAYAQLAGGPAMICGLTGSVLGGVLVDRFGARQIIAMGLVGSALVGGIGFGLGQAWWTDDNFIAGTMCLDALFGGFASVGMFALCMTVAWPRVAGTQFTAYMALLNLSSTIGYKIAGRFEAAFDYPTIFVLTGCWTALVSLLLLAIDPGETRRQLGDSHPAQPTEQPG